MKGSVQITEIYEDGTSKVVVDEDNLIVDGAGESIASFMSMPSSVAFLNGSVEQRILDTSNYIIQALAFGKGSLGYKENAHKYKRHNLIPSANEFFELESGITGYTVRRQVGITKQDDPSPFDGSSNVYKINALGTNSQFSFVSGAGVADLNGAVYAPKIFSVDLKYDFEDKLESPTTGPAAALRGQTTIILKNQGDDVSGTVLWYNGSTASVSEGDPSLMNNTLAVADTNLTNIFLKKLGGGWWRASVVSFSGTDYSQPLAFNIYPAGKDGINTWAGPNAPSGSIFVSRPTLNIGSVPVNYFLPNEDPYSLATDRVSMPHLVSSVASFVYGSPNDSGDAASGIYLPNTGGTFRSNVSSYDSIHSLPEQQNPVLTKLESDTETSYEESTDINLNLGHTPNFTGFIGKPVSLLSYVSSTGDLVGNALTPASATLPLDARFLGGMNPGSTGGVPTVSLNLIDGSLPSVPKFNSPVISASLNASGVAADTAKNTVRSVDISGFVRARYDGYGESAANNAFLNVSGENGIGVFASSTGEVIYKSSISKPDAAFLNFYGGVTEMGMYTLDYFETLKTSSGYSIDKDVDTGDDMKFKLFCRKTFNEDVTGRSDYSGNAGLPVPASIAIVWRLKFV
jgi:hypothetical protein